jgi:hypothetical protein
MTHRLELLRIEAAAAVLVHQREDAARVAEPLAVEAAARRQLLAQHLLTRRARTALGTAVQYTRINDPPHHAPPAPATAVIANLSDALAILPMLQHD